MRHRGKYGFTWDSKAEEWAAWALGCMMHNPPKTADAYRSLVGMWIAYGTENHMADIDRTARFASETTNPDPYSAIQWPDAPRKVSWWPVVAALIVLTAAYVAWMW